MSDNDIQYGGRDPMMLDRAGGYYQRHVNAMTTERLHEKSDIAAELGYRDMMAELNFAQCSITLKKNESLRVRIAELEAENERLRRHIDRALKACSTPSRPRQHVGEILESAIYPRMGLNSEGEGEG